MRRPSAAPELVLALTVTTIALDIAGAGGPVRVAATMLFLAVAPGLLLAPQLPGEPLARAAAVVALSFSVDVLVVTALLVIGAYDPHVALAALVVAALAGCRRAVRARRAWDAQETLIRIHRQGRHA